MRYFLVPLALLLAAGVALAEGAFKAGLWEVTVTMRMPGMPFQPQPMTFTKCMTDKDAAPNNPDSPHSRDCKIVDQKRADNKVSWKVKCAKGEGSGEVVYSGDGLDGTMKITMMNERSGQPMEVTQTMHGVYKGACSK